MVDDASANGEAIRAEAEAAGARYLRRETQRRSGGGAQRRAWRRASHELVACVDSDCVPRPGWLDALLPHFADPELDAVAPRIVALDEGSRGEGARRGVARRGRRGEAARRGAARRGARRVRGRAARRARWRATRRPLAARPRARARARHPVRPRAVRARRGARRPPPPALRRDAARRGGRRVRVARAVRALRARRRRSRTTTAPTRARGSRGAPTTGGPRPAIAKRHPGKARPLQRLAVDDRRVGRASPRGARSPRSRSPRPRPRCSPASSRRRPDPRRTAVELAGARHACAPAASSPTR